MTESDLRASEPAQEALLDAVRFYSADTQPSAHRGPFRGLLDADLYLPKGWAVDRPRCRAAGIPDTVLFRTKWQIALEQLDRAEAAGVKLDWLTFDEEYGKSPGFVAGLDEREVSF